VGLILVKGAQIAQTAALQHVHNLDGSRVQAVVKSITTEIERGRRPQLPQTFAGKGGFSSPSSPHSFVVDPRAFFFCCCLKIAIANATVTVPRAKGQISATGEREDMRATVGLDL